MSRVQSSVLGISLCFMAACGTVTPPAAENRQPALLEGLWIVTSVQRDGKPDPQQVGASLAFTDYQVTFEPKVKAEDVMKVKAEDAMKVLSMG